MLSNLLKNGGKCIEKSNFYIKYFDKTKCYVDRPYLYTYIFFGLSVLCKIGNLKWMFEHFYQLERPQKNVFERVPAYQDKETTNSGVKILENCQCKGRVTIKKLSNNFVEISIKRCIRPNVSYLTKCLLFDQTSYRPTVVSDQMLRVDEMIFRPNVIEADEWILVVLSLRE